MAKFEIVSKFNNAGLKIPSRKTTESAGYDLAAAEDTIIPSFFKLLKKYYVEQDISNNNKIFDLNSVKKIIKENGLKPTMVSTGVKCQLEPGTYLEISERSSCPKYLLFLANSIGIIDADYYNNPSNEGEIFFQLINLSPFDIMVQKGEAVGQGIIKQYQKTENDICENMLRSGGFGSTNK